MTGRFQSLAKRFADARPGLKLVAIEDAAIPVTTMRVDVVAQERQQLPIADEFVLRLVSQGVGRPGQIAAFLGLDDIPVLEAVAAQIAAGTLRRGSDGDVRLTALGELMAQDIAAIRPVERQLPVAFDRLVWRIAPYQEARLMEKGDAVEAGFRILPAARNARISLDDVPVGDFASLIRSELFQVLRVRRVSTRKHRYLPVQMLVYADPTTRELDLALCLEDRMSGVHGIGLSKLGAVERLGLRYEPTDERPLLDPELEEQRTSDPESALPVALTTEINDADTASRLVRGVGVFEHPALLDRALETAQQRLLVIAPWIRKAVVTADFMAKLERRLKARVQVTIAHGYGEDDRGSDDDALRRLSSLAARFENFSFVRLRNSHAKVLIFDNVWVSTSFNWLSFRGDPDRTYRMEEGTLVAIPKRVDEEYLRFQEMIRQQRL
jgi:hypothetical protein